MTAEQPTFLKDYRPPDFLAESIDLDIDINEKSTFVRAKINFCANYSVSNRSASLILNGIGLNLLDISLCGKKLQNSEFNIENESLIIFKVPDSFFIETLVEIFPKDNSTLSGLYASRDGYFTQCEAQGFRRLTYYLDRPDVMAKFTTRLQADKAKYPVLLSNGNLIEKGVNGKKHWVKWSDPFPKPSYLFAMVAAQLSSYDDSYTTKSGRNIGLHIFVRQDKIEQCSFAMEALKRAMSWDETVFGLEIDLDQYSIVAVDDFNMGAMENKGLNIFNTKYILADKNIATDRDYVFIDRIIAHEYFHNWTGNRVTCRDWFQLSLKEGLTVFRDQEYGADVYSRTVQRIQEVRNLRAVQFPEDAGPMAHAVRPQSYFEINNFYTATVYEKGAEVVRMLYLLLGQESFHKGMKLYFERHDGCAVTTDDFVQAMQDSSNFDLSQFKLWYDRPGTPSIKGRGVYRAENQTYELILEQSLANYDFDKDTPLHIPVKVGLIGPDGKDIFCRVDDLENLKTTHVLSLKKKQQTFVFSEVVNEPVISLLREFSAPVKLIIENSNNDLAHQIKYDTDKFNRWEACQELTARLIITSSGVKGRNIEKRQGLEQFFDAVETILEHALEEPSYTAEIMNFPSETLLAERMEIVDPNQLHLSRKRLIKEIATTFKVQLIALYKELDIENNQFSLQPLAANKRSLKNLCLYYLMELGDSNIYCSCVEQFKTSHNMTDRIAALTYIVNNGLAEKEWALNDFIDTWGYQDSVVDKWFAVQAASSVSSTLNTVEDLVSHQLFDYTNPNKVYSLLRTFGSNHLRFHDESGKAYHFLANQIIKLDSINPQVAARLSRSFDRCERFDDVRWSHAQNALSKINRTIDLSKDTREIVSKILPN